MDAVHAVLIEQMGTDRLLVLSSIRADCQALGSLTCCQAVSTSSRPRALVSQGIRVCCSSACHTASKCGMLAFRQGRKHPVGQPPCTAAISSMRASGVLHRGSQWVENASDWDLSATQATGQTDMDLVAILRDRINALPPGEYSLGLRAVLRHIEVGANHLSRGNVQADETAFTDAIYRTNQAFEGSLKEAYRVLTGQEPGRLRPSDIETYLQDQGLLRARVLAQFSNYRREWRNPATHDYRLDFDEDEALLAIVSVCAFAIVLCDQIAEKLSFEAAKAATPASSSPAKPKLALADTVVEAIRGFEIPGVTKKPQDHVREAEIVGAIAGYLSSAIPGLGIDLEPQLGNDGSVRPDMLISRGDKRLLLEVKRGGNKSKSLRQQYLAQAAHYIAVSGVKDALIYIHGEGPKGKLISEEHPLPGVNARVIILWPSPTEDPL